MLDNRNEFIKYCVIKRWRSLLVFVMFLIFSVSFHSCASENALDCFQSAGKITREEVSLDTFDKITVLENVTLVIKQGNTQKVEIETGENLRNEVSAVVKDRRLLLADTNDCNYTREYGTTVVYVTTPILAEIRGNTGFPIRSDGILGFDALTLLSENYNEPKAETTDGAFNLQLEVSSLNIVSNGIAYFKLSGKANRFNINIAAGDSRIEAQNLTVKNVNLNHRGSNDILIHPKEKLTGVIRGTGDVQSYYRPAEVDIQELFNGRLIFVE